MTKLNPVDIAHPVVVVQKVCTNGILMQKIKKWAEEGKDTVSIELGTLSIPLSPKDSEAIEIIECIHNDKDLEQGNLTLGEMEELLQEAIFQLQIIKKTGKTLNPKEGILFKDLLNRKAYFEVERVLTNHTTEESIEIFQDALVWLNITLILNYTDKIQGGG